MRQFVAEPNDAHHSLQTFNTTVERDKQSFKGKKEEEIYGVISKKEFDLILSQYDKLQAKQDTENDSVKCDQVKGGSLARLLFSKPGFHHPDSTIYLIDELKIRDKNRDSFLGGYSNNCPSSQDRIDSLLERQKRMHIREEARTLYNLLEKKTEAVGNFTESVCELVRLDPLNGDALGVRGKFSLEGKNYEHAIIDLESSLRYGCWDEATLKKDLSIAYYEEAARQYARNQYRDAFDKYTMALHHDNTHEGARLGLSMCHGKLSTVERQFGTKNSFTTMRK